jgi:hypothetical protein
LNPLAERTLFLPGARETPNVERLCRWYAEMLGFRRLDRPAIQFDGAGLDEGLLSLSLSNLLQMDNPYKYKKCQ